MDASPVGKLAGLWALTLALQTMAAAHLESGVVLDLGLRGEWLGNDVNSRFRVDDGFKLGAVYGSLSGQRFHGEMGDVSASWDDLSFASRGFRGLALGMPSGRINTTLLGGTVALEDLRGRTSVSPIYGLRTGWNAGGRVQLFASQLFTPSAPAGLGAGITSLAATYSPQERTRLAAEVARSSGGTAWQLSTNHRSRDFSFKARYRQADANFSTAGNPLLATQRDGYAVETGYKWGTASLDMTTQRYQDGRGGRDNFDSASVQFGGHRLPDVTLYWQRGDQLSLPFQEIEFQSAAEREAATRQLDLQPTHSENAGIQLGQRVGKNQLSFAVDHRSSRLLGTDFSAQSDDRFTVGLARPLGERTSLAVRRSWTANARAQVNAQHTDQYTEVRINHRFKSGVRLDVGMLQQNYSAGQGANSAVSSEVGVVVPVGRAMSLGFTYRTPLGGTGPLSKLNPRLQVQVSRSFDFRRKRGTLRRSAAQRRLLGAVEGRVFEDLNNDGKWQEGEPAVHGVTVALRSDIRQQSDISGDYKFSDLAPQSYRVRLQTRTVPIEYGILAPSDLAVTVPVNGAVRADFPLVRTGKILGTVFLDSNRNGIMDGDEKPMADVVVGVQGSEVISFSDTRGKFQLCNLPPGAWEITVDTESVAEKCTFTMAAPRVALAPGGTVPDLQLAIAPEQRSVVTSFEKTQ